MRHPSLITLSHDHHHALALALRCRKQALGQIQPAGAEGLRHRANEFRSFVESSLTSHFRAEEEVLFPFAESSVPEAREIIAVLLEEHREIRRLTALLAAEDRLSKFLFDAGDVLERHVRREERELFPLIERSAGAALESLRPQIEKVLARG
ncbi:MAG: hemerythrin domain-containing protein [Candidatus Binatia bacterium]